MIYDPRVGKEGAQERCGGDRPEGDRKAMNDAKTDEFSCTCGGACCLCVIETLHMTEEDFERWREEGRTDILQELGGISLLVRQDGGGHGRQTVRKNLFCPFLRFEGRQARCDIQDTKPEPCYIYQCGERSSATRLRGELTPETCYEKTMETVRQKWLAYLQDCTQEENQTQVVLMVGEKWPPPGEYNPEILPRLQDMQEREGREEKCLHTTAELKRYLVWGWL